MGEVFCLAGLFALDGLPTGIIVTIDPSLVRLGIDIAK